MLLYLLIFLVSFATTLLLTPVVRTLALKIGAVDNPNKRKVHKHATARLGGIAIYCGFILAVIVVAVSSYFFNIHINYLATLGIVGSSTIILVVGFIDDIMGMGAWLKLLLQTLAAALAVSSGVAITYVSSPYNGPIEFGLFSIPITIFWIVGLTNAVNLIDGLDGLASGITAIASVTLFFVAIRTHQIGTALLLLSLGGASAGFLRYNFNPASIFLGDSGSLFLGFVLACCSVVGVLKSTLVIALIIPILILGVPIFDTMSAIVRRVRARVAIFEADDRHIHHRLMKAGLSQREAVMAIYFVCILLSLSALVVTFMKPVETIVLLTVIFMVALVGAYRIRASINLRTTEGER